MVEIESRVDDRECNSLFNPSVDNGVAPSL
jgi:hypothetical protein